MPRPGSTSTGRDNLAPKGKVDLKVYLDSASQKFVREGASKARLSQSEFARKQIEAGNFADQVRVILKTEIAALLSEGIPSSSVSDEWKPLENILEQIRSITRQFQFRFDLAPPVFEKNPVEWVAKDGGQSEGTYGIEDNGKRYLVDHFIAKAAALLYGVPEFMPLVEKFYTLGKQAVDAEPKAPRATDTGESQGKFFKARSAINHHPLHIELWYYRLYGMALGAAINYYEENPDPEFPRPKTPP